MLIGKANKAGFGLSLAHCAPTRHPVAWHWYACELANDYWTPTSAEKKCSDHCVAACGLDKQSSFLGQEEIRYTAATNSRRLRGPTFPGRAYFRFG